jgi:L-fuculose-phosphate aldolase
MTSNVKTELKSVLVDIGKKMLHEGLTVGTWGNFSLRDPETNLIYITPSGMNYDEIVNDDIVVMDSSLNIVDGSRVPSVEKFMHVAVYNARSDVNAVIHTHPLYSTVLGVNGMELPGISEDFVQIVGDKMICSEYALPGTPELAKNAVAGLGNRNGVLLPNHGTLVVGPDMAMTCTICQIVEKTAQIYILAKSIGTPNLISMEDIIAMQEYVKNKYGQS